MLDPRPRIRFWPHTDDARVASTRIRCHQVLAGLQQHGVDAALFRPDAGEPAPAALVLGKRYDTATLRQAAALREQAGTRLLLDLCDNHFHADQPKPEWLRRAQVLRDACRAVDLVVVASPTLAEVVAHECGADLQVVVVPDALDRSAGQALARRRLAELWQAWRWRAFAARHPVQAGRRLLWFGNHGTGYADGGMADLNLIAPALAQHHQAQPLTLTVVSNLRARFDELAPAWPWPSTYLPWSDANFALALSQHDIALIPVSRNPFTLSKTNNRLATAFLNGLAVAADSLPSYVEFADLAVLDDWERGLGRLMADADGRARRVSQARPRLEAHYGIERISGRWIELLQQLGVLRRNKADT
jgi:hypothetical protein